MQGIFFSRTVADLAVKYRLPSASVLRQFAQAGGLMSYGADVPDIFRRSAVLVHRIIGQGTKPADLPVELPTKFELVINLKTAKALALDVPWFLQQRADEVCRAESSDVLTADDMEQLVPVYDLSEAQPIQMAPGVVGMTFTDTKCPSFGTATEQV